MKAQLSQKRTPFKNLALVFASIFFVLVLVEIYLRLFVPARCVGASFTVYDPVYGKKLKKNFTAIRKGRDFTMRFTTNSLGFRGQEPKRPLNRAILFLGDSFTMGYGVTDGEEFPALIQKDLGVSVINAGIGENGNGQWLKFLKREAVKYNPRLIVFQFMDNDFRENFQEHFFELTPAGELRENHVPPPSKERMMQRVIEFIPGLSNSYLMGIARQLLLLSHKTKPISKPEEQKDSLSNSKEKDLQEQLTFRLVEGVLIVCKERHWQVISLSVEIKDRRLVKLKEILERYGIKNIEIPERNERPDLYNKIDGHWNASGHAFVAKAIREEIQKRR